MVTRYDVISSRWSSLFEWKCMSFQLLLTIKVKLVDEMMQRAYSCVTLHVKHKTLPFVAVLTWFLILSKIQNGDQDGDHCWWRHRPPAAPLPLEYTSYCWEDRRRSTKGKNASKYCNISKTLGRGSTRKRTQQLPTFMAQRFWELFRLFACSLQQWVSFHHSPPFDNVVDE